MSRQVSTVASGSYATAFDTYCRDYLEGDSIDFLKGANPRVYFIVDSPP